MPKHATASCAAYACVSVPAQPVRAFPARARPGRPRRLSLSTRPVGSPIEYTGRLSFPQHAPSRTRLLRRSTQRASRRGARSRSPRGPRPVSWVPRPSPRASGRTQTSSAQANPRTHARAPDSRTPRKWADESGRSSTAFQTQLTCSRVSASWRRPRLPSSPPTGGRMCASTSRPLSTPGLGRRSPAHARSAFGRRAPRGRGHYPKALVISKKSACILSRGNPNSRCQRKVPAGKTTSCCPARIRFRASS